MKEDDEIKVKMRYGDLELEVQGDPDKVYSLLSKIVGELGGEHTHTPESKYKRSCKEVIEDLWREGWFEKDRKLSEVYLELSTRGYNFDKSAISHALAAMTREGKLKRLGKERKHRYIQKYPYTETIKRR